jgi:hypothetical protein
MAPPTAKTSAGDKVLVGADTDVRDPKQRVQDYMRTMMTGTYTVVCHRLCLAVSHS